MASPKRSRRSDGDDRDRGRGRDSEHSRRRSSDDDRRGRGRDWEREERRRSGDDRVGNLDRERHRERDEARSVERGEEKWRSGNGSGREIKDESRNGGKEFKEPRSVDQVFRKERRDRDDVDDPIRKRVKEEPRDKENEIGDEVAAGSPRKTEKDTSIALMEEAEAALEAKEQAKEKEKASFEYSGNLAVETNKVSGVALQFTEPPEARQPTVRWRLYVFKDGAALDEPLFIHRQSCYLFGRERKVADIPIDHPSCSKQHAVIQYRLIEKEVDGLMSKRIRPYVMDLGSTNKTFLNGEAIEPQRYYELFEKDTLKFGNSSREYVLLHENSA